MRLPNNILKKLIRSAFCGMLFCFALTIDVNAQSEKEKPVLGQSKSYDYSHLEGERQDLSAPIFEKNQYKTNSSANSVVRDNSGYIVEENKKEIKEEGKSTLSFNIFLYVLDRFKEN